MMSAAMMITAVIASTISSMIWFTEFVECFQFSFIGNVIISPAGSLPGKGKSMRAACHGLAFPPLASNHVRMTWRNSS
jgi:hypothetical protein